MLPLISNRNNWIIPAIKIDHAKGKCESDLNIKRVTIINTLRITDRNEGKKNLPLMFKTELITAESVTNIKKGKIIGINWMAKLNWSSFSKKPGASKAVIWPLKK